MNKLWLPLILWGVGFGAGTRPFSHYQHVKTEELECSDCHRKTMNSTSLEANVKVPWATCSKCHADDTTFKVEFPYTQADSSFRIPKRSLPGDFKFDHKAHVSSKVACAECHGEAVKPGASSVGVRVGTTETLMGMRNCMECHMKKAEVSCLTCHDKMEKPLGHLSSAWIHSEGHGLQSNLKSKDCALCHENNKTTSCAECHMGTDASKVHGANYRFNHGEDVTFKKLDCAVCHQPLQQFCGDCHEGKGRTTR
jgi:Cytochrome c7 and related cytochrome c